MTSNIAHENCIYDSPQVEYNGALLYEHLLPGTPASSPSMISRPGLYNDLCELLEE